MFALRPTAQLALLTTLTLAVAACGRGLPVGAKVVTNHGLAVRGAAGGDPWYNTINMLENFTNNGHGYQAVGEDDPFFNTPVATIVPFAPGGRVLEILAPAGEAKFRRGAYVTSDVNNGQTFDYTHNFAPHLLVTFDWANNGVTLPARGTYLEAIFLFSYSVPGAENDNQAAIAYAWTNDATVPGSWIQSSLNYGQPTPLRVLPIQNGLGGVGDPAVPQACSQAAMNQLKLHTVARQFEKDVAQAYPELFPGGTATGAGPSFPVKVNDQTTLTVDGRYLNKTNTTAITSVFGVGGGCDLPQTICSHGILDNFTMTRLTTTGGPGDAPTSSVAATGTATP